MVYDEAELTPSLECKYMTDATAFIVRPLDQSTKNKLFHGLVENGKVITRFGKGFIRLHGLTEGTISIANTGAATDTLLLKTDAALCSYLRSALFNATINNLDKTTQAIIGYLVMVDHTTTSPNTDAGTILARMRFFMKSGTSPTYSSKSPCMDMIELTSEQVVNAAAIAEEAYAGPFLIRLRNPIIAGRDDGVTEYLGVNTEVQRMTSIISSIIAAHTAVTTYTFKVTAWVILADPEVLADYHDPEHFWQNFAPNVA